MADVIKKIGSAVGGTRDYSDIQAWEDACPVDLTATGGGYVGEFYNDSELAPAAGIQISGVTTDATHFVTLRCAVGHSFYDNANKATNALRYNQSNGAGILLASPFAGDSMVVATNYTVIDGLQFRTSGTSQAFTVNMTGTNCVLRNSIVFRPSSAGNTAAMVHATDPSSRMVNCLAIDEAGQGGAFSSEGGAPIIACTAIKINGGSGGAFNSNYGAPLTRNCLSLGYVSFNRSGSFSGAGSDYNAADLPGTGNDGLAAAHCVKNLVIANTIMAYGAGTALDARVKAGSLLIGAGLRDQAYTGDVDIAKQARSVTTPTIGAWEYVIAGGSAAALAGSATSSSIATGSINTSIKLAGVSSSASLATGSLLTAIKLVGSATTVSLASGAVSTAIKLAGNAATVSSASNPSLNTQINLSGQAVAISTASGVLTTFIKLAGDAYSVSLATASLTAFGNGLSGAAISSSTASGLLTTAIKLGGVAASLQTGTGALSTGIVITGNASSTATGSGSLITGIKLAGVAASLSVGSANLLTTINLTGSAASASAGSGALSTGIRLVGGASSISIASGTLYSNVQTIIVVDSSRSVIFDGGTNKITFAGGSNKATFGGGINSVVFPGGNNKVTL